MKSILVFLIASIGITAVFISGPGATVRSVEKSMPTMSESFAQPQQLPAVVDGATHPELIPDRVAYSVLFRLISNRQTPEQKSRIRAYIRQIGFAEADIDGLVAVADEFHSRVSLLDGEAKQIKAFNRGVASPEIRAQLWRLQQQKEAIVDHMVLSLAGRLSADASAKLQQHVANRVKRNIKFRRRSTS